HEAGGRAGGGEGPPGHAGLVGPRVPAQGVGRSGSRGNCCPVREARLRRRIPAPYHFTCESLHKVSPGPEIPAGQGDPSVTKRGEKRPRRSKRTSSWSGPALEARPRRITWPGTASTC